MWTKVTCSTSFETWCKQVLFNVEQKSVVEYSSFQMVKQDGIPPLEIEHFLSSFLMVRMLDRLFENLTTPQPDKFQATIQNPDKSGIQISIGKHFQSHFQDLKWDLQGKGPKEHNRGPHKQRSKLGNNTSPLQRFSWAFKARYSYPPFPFMLTI